MAGNQSIDLFVSYARADEVYKDKLLKYLSPFRRMGLVNSWNDREMIAGQAWDEEIKTQLDRARIALFLVSPDFMFSDYIHDVEIKRALERHAYKELLIIPIVIRPVDLSFLEIRKFQALPRDARPIASWEQEDAAWLDVQQGLKRVFAAVKEGRIALKCPKKIVTVEEMKTLISLEVKEEIIGYVERGDVGEAIKQLRIMMKPINERIYMDTVQLSERWSGLSHQLMQGVISYENASIERARITAAILDLLTK